jgi:hypothetical protein
MSDNNFDNSQSTSTTQLHDSSQETTTNSIYNNINQNPDIITTIQQTINSPKYNLPFGDLLHSKDNSDIRLFFCNVNGICTANTWNDLHSSCKIIKSSSIDIIGLAETNIKWDTRWRNQTFQIFKKHLQHVNISTSSSSEQSYSAYQPGGTLTAVTGNCTGRFLNYITDDTNMGRWSGITMTTNFNHQLHILTVYQSTRSSGPHTAYQQQRHKLSLMGIENPNPRKILLDNLATQIIKWNNNGDHSIIMIDANDNPYLNDSLLPKFLSNTQLISLVPNPQEHPATHIQGSKCIDFIYGSAPLIENVTRVGITSFFEEPFGNSVHCGIFIDISETALFGAHLNTPIPPTTRTVTSNSKHIISKFINAIDGQNNIPPLYKKIQQLSLQTVWTDNHH